MIKCALISSRHMGMMHGSNFHNHAEAEVVAVCDMDPDLREKAETEFQVSGYESIDELLANCDVDLILLIVNETRRISPFLQLLAAGQNVFTEKPLCGLEGQHRLREADAAIAAPAILEWRDSGLKFGIDFNYRFMHHFQKLHGDVVEGRLGEIQMVRARAHFACWSHVIDQILWSMGRPEWVSVVGDSDQEGEWQRMIHMGCANGTIGTLDGTNTWGMEYPLGVMIVGDSCYAEAWGLEGRYRRCKANSSEVEEQWESEEGKPEMPKSFVRMANGVIQSMLKDQPFPADGDAAWNELVFEATVHRSASNSSKRVWLDEVETAAILNLNAESWQSNANTVR